MLGRVLAVMINSKYRYFSVIIYYDGVTQYILLLPGRVKNEKSRSSSGRRRFEARKPNVLYMQYRHNAKCRRLQNVVHTIMCAR